MTVKTIAGYPNYIINEDGEVFNTTFKNSRTSKLLQSPKKMKASYKQGYPFVTLSANGKSKSFLVHRLVLLTFVGSPEEGLEASHLDGNRSNCSLSNLVWESRSANHQRKEQHGTAQKGSKNPWAKLDEFQVVQIKQQINEKRKQRDIASDFNVSEQIISDIKYKKRWAHV